MLTDQKMHTNLPETYFLTVPHLLEVPEERLVTFLTGVTIQPLRGLQHTHIETQNKSEQQTEKLPMEPRDRKRGMDWDAVMWPTKLN